MSVDQTSNKQWLRGRLRARAEEGGRLCLVWAYQVRSRDCGDTRCDLKAAISPCWMCSNKSLIEGTQSQQLIAH